MSDGSRPETGEMQLPAPTAAPLFFALGLTLLFAGLVTDALVSAVGFAFAAGGAVGWWRQVLPREAHERAPLQSPHERPAPVVAQPGRVAHLRAGEAGHRVRLPARIQPYSSGLRGGAAGGAAMAVVALAYGLLARGSPWWPVNLAASALLPSLDAANAEALLAFQVPALAAAIFIHAGLSLLVGLVYAALLPTLPGNVLLWGGLVAPLVWSGLVWVSLGVIAPALHEHIAWFWFVVSQIVFGLAAGAVIARAQPIDTLQTWPLAARAGLESPGLRDEPEDRV